MQRLAAIALSACLAPVAGAQEALQVRLATAAATQWVELVDAGDDAASWRQAAQAFQAAISEPDWRAAVRAARTPLGALTSRKLLTAQYTQSLPGAPAGEYVVIRFESHFEKKGAAVETVTPMKGKDGTWRVSGYFVH